MIIAAGTAGWVNITDRVIQRRDLPRTIVCKARKTSCLGAIKKLSAIVLHNEVDGERHAKMEGNIRSTLKDLQAIEKLI